MRELLIELLLAGGLVVLAVRLLWFGDLFESIVLFIVFGLLMTLLWAGWGAVDVALAEAAIGSGLTGALLLAAWRAEPTASPAESRSGALWVPIAVAALGVFLGWCLQLGIAMPGGGLATTVSDAVPRSGVESPVTAVLLNFRGYDTLLEVGVLVAAWLAIAPRNAAEDGESTPPNDVLSCLGRLWPPLVLVAAAYVVWAGARLPGGAFQSAALLAGAAILLDLVGVRIPLRLPAPLRSAVPVLGFGVFAVAATVGIATRQILLRYPDGQAGAWILAIELAMSVSLACLLFALYRGVSRRGGGR